MEEVRTCEGDRKGSTLFYVGDGYFYRRNSGPIYFKCVVPTCKARQTKRLGEAFFEPQRIGAQGHNHGPDVEKLGRQRFLSALKVRAETSNHESLRQLFNEESNL